MKINKTDVVFIAVSFLLGVYLFAQSPVPLQESDKAMGELIHVTEMFKIVAEENNKARKQWTKQIVVAGKKSGLEFGEDWKDHGIDKGPLPALFLRETAMNLEKSPVPLSLFLGSDFPIASANKFKGQQAYFFKKIRLTGSPQFFYDEDIKRYTAMFPDNVVVKACASCHNKHENSPKKDWKMHDIMGATTWSYPKEYVTRDQLLSIISELRKAFSKTYDLYVGKVRGYNRPPQIGLKWPSEGYFVPSTNVFIERYEQAASFDTMKGLLKKNKLNVIATANTN